MTLKPAPAAALRPVRISATALILALLAICLPLAASAQTTPTTNGMLPAVGSRAPELHFTKLLNAPPGAKATLASLRGRVVVLEFWATWCAPCLGEIPVLNGLASSLDPTKVQFISVDDEDPALVAAFLKHKPIKGWVALDTTGATFKRYGVDARPATIVIGPDGRIVSNSVHPENLQRAKLLALAAGKHTDVSGKADPKVKAEMEATMSQAFAAQIGSAAGPADALFDLRISAAEPVKSGPKPDTHVMMMGPGELDITNADIQTLVSMGAGVAASRIKVEGTLPGGLFNLHFHAPSADPQQLNRSIELAIASATGITIDPHTNNTDALILTAISGVQRTLSTDEHGGFGFYQKSTHSIRCLNASMDQLAGALEEALGKPVVNETGLSGKANLELPLPDNNLATANTALAKSLGLTLTPATRPIETVTLKPAPTAAKK